MKSIITLFAFLLMVHFTAYAVEPARTSLSDTLRIEEIVITATKTKRALKDVPARVAVINSKTIELSPAMQIDDILRFVPGVNVNRSSGIYAQRPMVTLRGLSGDEQSRTLVLLNGIPINTSDEGGVNWNRINTNDIERIEVFKGPGSSLYGNNALGGVINLISRKPDKPQELFAALSYGTFNTVRQDLNIRIKTEKGYYGSISQYFVKSDGYNNVPKANRTPYDKARFLEEIGVSARAGNDINPWFNWELQYDIFRDKRGEGYQIHTPEGCYRNFNTNLFRGTIKGGNKKTQYDVSLYYQLEHYYDINEKLQGGNYTRYDVNAFRSDKGAIASASHQLFKNNTLTAGAEWKEGGIDGGDYYQTAPYDTIQNAGKISTISGYFQDEYALFNNKISLVAGLRFDHVAFSDGEFYSTDPWNTTPALNDNTWNELSPRLGARFNFIEQVSAYLSYSHGFRASILDDLTRSGWMWVGPKYANPNLGPESLNNFEIGADLFPIEKLKISATVWYSLGKDFLYYVSTGDSLFGRSIYIRENVTNLTSRGAELSLEYQLNPNLNFMASYTYTKSVIGAFDQRPDLVNKQLKYAPVNSASASVFWQNKIVNTSISALYKDKQFTDDLNSISIDPYFTLDLQLSRPINEHFIISLDVQDLLNNQHLEPGNYLSPGRLFNVRLALKL